MVYYIVDSCFPVYNYKFRLLSEGIYGVLPESLTKAWALLCAFEAANSIALRRINISSISQTLTP